MGSGTGKSYDVAGRSTAQQENPLTIDHDTPGPESDLDQAAADFRMRYYGPANNPDPPAAMAELAPEIMKLVDSVVYGEVYNRPAVDLKTRSLCTIAALVVLGHSPEMIKRHITGALHIGVTREEISEIIGQMIFYGGMPAAVRAFRVAKETFDEQGDEQGVEPETAPATGTPSAPRSHPGRGVSGIAPYRPRPRVDQPRPEPTQRPEPTRQPESTHRPGQQPQRPGQQPQRPGQQPQRPGQQPQRPGQQPQRPGPDRNPSGPEQSDHPEG
jgi:4-carboxymuconolactone decarboxylase